jgi:hypothetical protein
MRILAVFSTILPPKSVADVIAVDSSRYPRLGRKRWETKKTQSWKNAESAHCEAPSHPVHSVFGGMSARLAS